jgi:hypothetical protein
MIIFICTVHGSRFKSYKWLRGPRFPVVIQWGSTEVKRLRTAGLHDFRVFRSAGVTVAVVTTASSIQLNGLLPPNVPSVFRFQYGKAKRTIRIAGVRGRLFHKNSEVLSFITLIEL